MSGAGSYNLLPKMKKPLSKLEPSTAAMTHQSLPCQGMMMPPDSTPPPDASTELMAAVGHVIASQVLGEDISHTLEDMDQPLLQLLEDHLRVTDRLMNSWLKFHGLPALEESSFWTTTIIPMIQTELQRRSVENQTT